MVLVLLLRYLCGGFRVTSRWAVTRY